MITPLNSRLLASPLLTCPLPSNAISTSSFPTNLLSIHPCPAPAHITPLPPPAIHPSVNLNTALHAKMLTSNIPGAVTPYNATPLRPDAHRTVRIDKWLWAVRIFKTRSQATDACRAGKVKVDGAAVKPSREVKTGMVIIVQTGPIQKQLQVVALLHSRVGAKLVPQYMLDLTPKEEYQKLEAIRASYAQRPRGSGRPTKKERREMDDWMDWE